MRILLAITTVLALAVPAHSEPKGDIGKRVDAHLTRGIGFYAQKQYELAIIEFRAGYALDPRPDFLFALAQAERLSGDCTSAVVYYRRFLKTNPGTNQAEAARVNMRRCTRALESGPKAAKDVAEKPAEPPEPAKPPTARAAKPAPRQHAGAGASARASAAPSRPWFKDRVAVSLAAGAGVSLVVGGGFWIAKVGAESDASSATDDVAYRDHLSRARRNRNISAVGLGLGVVLSAATAYRIVSRKHEHRRGAMVVATPVSGGGAVTILGSF